MAKTLQLRRGTTSEVAAITSASGELLVDTQQKTVTVGDGSTAGGTYLATDARVSSAFATANGANGLASGAFASANTNATNITAVNGYAVSAFATANGANGLAAGAFNTANGANGLAAGAFASANTSATNISIMSGVNTTQNTNITAVNGYATSAYASANTNATNITAVNGYATSAYNSANTNATNITSVNGYATSAYATANGANGMAVGAHNRANSAFTQANNANGMAVGAFNAANSASSTASSASTTATGANGLAAGAFNKANSAVNFGTIYVSGQPNVIANTANAGLTFVAGSGMTITTSGTSNTITFASSGGGGGGATYNQSLNTTDPVTFNSINITPKAQTTVILAWANTAGAVVATPVDSFSSTVYGTAKYKIYAVQPTGYQISEVMVLHDGITAFACTTSNLYTNASLGTFSASLSGGLIYLQIMSNLANTRLDIVRDTITYTSNVSALVPNDLLNPAGTDVFVDLNGSGLNTDLNN